MRGVEREAVMRRADQSGFTGYAERNERTSVCMLRYEELEARVTVVARQSIDRDTAERPTDTISSCFRTG